MFADGLMETTSSIISFSKNPLALLDHWDQWVFHTFYSQDLEAMEVLFLQDTKKLRILKYVYRLNSRLALSAKSVVILLLCTIGAPRWRYIHITLGLTKKMNICDISYLTANPTVDLLIPCGLLFVWLCWQYLVSVNCLFWPQSFGTLYVHLPINVEGHCARGWSVVCDCHPTNPILIRGYITCGFWYIWSLPFGRAPGQVPGEAAVRNSM